MDVPRCYGFLWAPTINFPIWAFTQIPKTNMSSSSLAAQLSKGVSFNAPLLVDRSRRKHTESYLFTSREADQLDFYSLYALGVNGLSKLKTLDAKFAKYDDTLFSNAARGLDRTLQSENQNAELDRIIGLFLRDLGPYLLEAPTSKALEWVIRRFRSVRIQLCERQH